MSEDHSSHKGICGLSFQFTGECRKNPFEKQGSTDSKGSRLTLCFSGKHNHSCSCGCGCGCRRAETCSGLHSVLANNKQKQQNTPKTANRNKHSTTKPKTCPFYTLKTCRCQLVALPMMIKGQLLSLFGHLENNADRAHPIPNLRHWLEKGTRGAVSSKPIQPRDSSNRHPPERYYNSIHRQGERRR